MAKNNFLFNFSASYSGGGYKRLYAFAEWFDKCGGAYFLINSKCHSLINQFQNNNFIVISQSKLQRLFMDCVYLDQIKRKIGRLALYYSYGIPIYYKVGEINWFHISNVLPLQFHNVSLSFYDQAKFTYLGRRIKNNYKNADVISAESDFSLGLIDKTQYSKIFLSVNGSDDEFLYQSTTQNNKDDIATVVGTYSYKALDDAFRVFEMLKDKNDCKNMVIIGLEKDIPNNIRKDKNVITKGSLPRNKVIEILQTSKAYISTTYIENSYNAASEGVFLANDSFISDICPHRQLLMGLTYKQIAIPKMNRSILHVKKEDMSTINIKKWDTVITEMLHHIKKENVINSK